ncbi:hypothetical protein P4O66_020052 [Electrophorus voltai]|uniref:EF-hand domain-containing protein n=1 Tax=Electrophorus voltai TaxID=2609070 RepID=A0AAD9E4A4_9TELE|nr:EF-hand calcium-binding domain-containing protein 9 [Electrophorus electricus]KAK1804571.1 hypothetical protein P4O66_020052 [Electrophorus voltai]
MHGLTVILPPDVQFYHFMRHVSDLGKEQIMMTFDLLDWSASGEISFEAFHLLACILLCCEYRVEREFMHHHSAHIFELLDTQGSGSIRRAELQAFGFLFNVTGNVLYRIIDELDIPEILYYKEYKIFVMACAEMKAEANKMRNKKTEHERSKQHECQPPRHLT